MYIYKYRQSVRNMHGLYFIQYIYIKYYDITKLNIYFPRNACTINYYINIYVSKLLLPKSITRYKTMYTHRFYDDDNDNGQGVIEDCNKITLTFIYMSH